MLISFFFPEIDFRFEKIYFFSIIEFWFCASLTVDAAVTLCARRYIAAARKRMTDVRNGIRGIGMRSL